MEIEVLHLFYFPFPSWRQQIKLLCSSGRRLHGARRRGCTSNISTEEVFGVVFPAACLVANSGPPLPCPLSINLEVRCIERQIDFNTGVSCHSPMFRNSREIIHGRKVRNRGMWGTNILPF